MKHISILVPKGAVALGCIEGPFILFNKVNEFFKSCSESFCIRIAHFVHHLVHVFA